MWGKKIIVTLVSWKMKYLLIAAFFLVGEYCIAEPLDAALNYGRGGTFYLNSSITYQGGVYVTADTIVFGNGATCQLSGDENIAVVNGALLEIHQCRIDGGIVIADGSSGPPHLVIENVYF